MMNKTRTAYMITKKGKDTSRYAYFPVVLLPLNMNLIGTLCKGLAELILLALSLPVNHKISLGFPVLRFYTKKTLILKISF